MEAGLSSALSYGIQAETPNTPAEEHVNMILPNRFFISNLIGLLPWLCLHIFKTEVDPIAKVMFQVANVQYPKLAKVLEKYSLVSPSSRLFE